MENTDAPRAPRAPFFIFQEIQTPIIKEELAQKGILSNDPKYNTMYQESIMKRWGTIQLGTTETDRAEKVRIEQIASDETSRYKREMEEYLAKKKAIVQPQSPAPADILKIFEKEMTDIQCPICTDFFNRPITLPCQHTFCKSCLIKNKNIRGIICSICRQKHDIDLNSYQEDKIIMGLVKYAIGPEEYNKIKNRVDPEDAARKLYEWYTGNGGDGESVRDESETCMIVDDCIQSAIQHFLNSNQNRLLINLDNFMNDVFGDNISVLAGFPLGNLKYYHLRRLMQSEFGAQLKFFSIRDVTILVNMKNFTTNWVTIITNQNTPWEQKELYYLLKHWVDNDGYNSSQYLEEYFYSKIPKNCKDFNFALYDRSKIDPARFALDFFMSEISKIIATPINYIPFAEILGLK
jgi:hypothetical protein